MPAPGYPVGQGFQAPAAGPELGLNMRDSTLAAAPAVADLASGPGGGLTQSAARAAQA